MKRALTPTLHTLTIFLLAAGAALAGNTYLNLDFEAGEAGQSPRNWYAGGKGYQGSLSADAPHSGKLCLLLARNDSSEKGFGVATSTFPVAAAAGHRIRYTGWIRTAGVTEAWAGLWWRVDGPDGTLAFDNMASRGVKGDTEWTEYTIELEVPAEATNINFGCILPGNGQAWFDDLQVRLDGELYEQIVPVPVVLNEAQLAWLRDNAHPFATDDPDHGNQDLGFVKQMVGDAHLVALGEGTHGTAEFFRMKHRLVRYLAQELGFTVFAIEASMPECERLNDYVLTGVGDPAELVAGMYFWTWKTEEVLALVRWMRHFNEQGGHLEFHGFDMQHPAWSMKEVQDLVAAQAPDLLLPVATAYAELRGLIKGSKGGQPIDVSDQLISQITDVRVQLAARQEALAAAVGARAAAWAVQYARLVEQYAEMTRGGGSDRDRCMAENVDWLQAQAAPGTKLILWAHNGHVARDGYGGFPSMGTLLGQGHGNDLVVFGFCFHAGTYTAAKQGEGLGAWGTSPSRPGTGEWAFHQTGQPRLMLDLGQAEPESALSGWVFQELELRSIGAMAMDEAFRPGVLADKYDVMVYFEKSTPSVQLSNQPPSPWAVWEQ